MVGAEWGKLERNKFQRQSSLHVQGLNAKYMTSTITTNLGAELNNYEDRTLKINKQTNGRKRWKITIKTLKGGHKLGRRVAQVWGQGALHGLQVSRTDQGCNRHCQISKVIKWWFYKCSTSLCEVYLIGSLSICKPDLAQWWLYLTLWASLAWHSQKQNIL